MRIIRLYLAREIYYSCAVVLFSLLGLFTFFALVDGLDSTNTKFTPFVLFYTQALSFPTRLYDMLPIGLLIGTTLALSRFSQRSELTILRTIGMSSIQLLFTLWIITAPLIIGALFISEVVVPIAGIKNSEIDLKFRNKSRGECLESGYWFKEPLIDGGTRIINVARVLSDGRLENLIIYQFDKTLELNNMFTAENGRFLEKGLFLKNVNKVNSRYDLKSTSDEAKPRHLSALEVVHLSQYKLESSLCQKQLSARILNPEHMSLIMLFDYVKYLQVNHLQADRHLVAMWRKLSYPLTILVMVTVAVPVGFMQIRNEDTGSKVFISILLGLVFFILNQIMVSLGLLNSWHPGKIIIIPNVIALTLSLIILLSVESNDSITEVARQHLSFRRYLYERE